MWGTFSVFSGNANRPLAEAVCRYLNISLGRLDVFEFSNENIFVKINHSVREQDVFVIQPTCSPVNRSILELLIIIDALKRASAARITAVLPYYGYGRTDKKDQPRVPITARLIADLLTVAGANRVLTIDLHAGQIQGFFSIPVDELTASFIFMDYFREKRLRDVVVVAPDLGAAKRARNFAAGIDAPLAIVEKRRNGNSGQLEALNIIGEVAGCQVIVFDDEIDTAGSLMEAVQALTERGVGDIFACCTHAVLSGPAIERLRGLPVKELVVTDTVPLPPEKQLPNITVLSLASLLGEAISRIHAGRSIGELFGE